MPPNTCTTLPRPCTHATRRPLTPGPTKPRGFCTSAAAMPLPKGTPGTVRETLRKLIGYFEHNRHRTDYPTYQRNGWDIGSGPTEAGCKIIGERLKGSGMRWVEHGAATVGVLRALYVSSPKLWDGFWDQPYRAAA